MTAPVSQVLSEADGKVLSAVPMSPFRDALAWILARPLVALVDHDGEVTVRVAKRDRMGRYFAYRWWIISRSVILGPLGHTYGISYVKRWIPLNDRAAALAKEQGK